MRALLLGAGNMGRAIGAALAARGDTVVGMVGRDRSSATHDSTHDPIPADVAFGFSHGDVVLDDARLAARSGARVLVVGTTGWAHDPETVVAFEDAVRVSGLQVVVGPTFSVGVVLFSALAEDAARRFGRFAAYDPYVFEWHRRTKPDRPSGTADAIAARMLPHLEHKRRARLAEGQGAPDPETLEVVSLRAGASPGMHVVGFDAPGESIELRVTARDRSAYVAGALLAADTLLDHPRPAGVITFEQLLSELTTIDTTSTPGDDR